MKNSTTNAFYTSMGSGSRGVGFDHNNLRQEYEKQTLYISEQQLSARKAISLNGLLFHYCLKYARSKVSINL